MALLSRGEGEGAPRAPPGPRPARQYLAQSEAEGPGLTGMALLSRAALTAPAFKTPRPGPATMAVRTRDGGQGRTHDHSFRHQDRYCRACRPRAVAEAERHGVPGQRNRR